MPHLNSEDDIVLQLRGIARRKPGSESWLLKEIDLSIRLGEIIVISGPTGSGKSLLLRTLGWLDPVDEGCLIWRGHELTAREVPSYRSQVMYLRQTPTLGEGTVVDCLQKVFRFKQHAGQEFRRDAIERSLSRLGKSPGLLAQDLETLSGGERQIVQLLRALQFEPQILLLDEPTAALDRASTQQVEQLIDDWFQSDTDRSIVWVSHSAEQIQRLTATHYQMIAGHLQPEPGSNR